MKTDSGSAEEKGEYGRKVEDSTSTPDGAARSRIFLTVAVLAFVTRVLLKHFVLHTFVDDAYIYFRYSDNWAAGLGLVYNPGERVIAFTSYLWVVLIGGIKELAGGFPTTSIVTIVNTLLFAVYCYVLWRFLDRRRLCYWAVVIMLLFYFPFVDASVNGMETTLFLVVLVATLLALRKGRSTKAISLAAIAVVTRPEGVMLLLPACAISWRSLSSQKRLMAAAFSAVTIIAAILIPIYLYFGTVLPHSMLAKSSQVTSANWGGTRTSALSKALLLAFGMSDGPYLHLPGLARGVLIAAFAVGAGAFFLGMFRARGKDPAILAAAAFYLLVLGFYVVGNPVRIFSWYSIPTAVCFVLVATFGIEEAFVRASYARLGSAAAAAAAVLCAGSFLALPYRVHTEEAHTGDLSRLAQRIHRDYGSAESLMIADIGVVGYASQMRIIDLAGLVSPISVAEENGQELSFGRIVEVSRPDIICLKNNPLTHTMINESSLQHRSFENEAERHAFIRAYVPADLGSSVCPFAFVRWELANHR